MEKLAMVEKVVYNGEYCIMYKGQYLTYAQVAIKLMELDKIKEQLKEIIE